MAPRLTFLLLAIVVLAVIIPSSSSGGGAYAFGAGNIPNFAYLEGKAFRHGDIEDILSDLVKKAAGSGFLGMGGGASKFSALDVKRVYFGNWLRDYSQAVDIGGLKQVQLQTILNICMVLGFMAHGYATGAFEVTAERLGTYLPVEHIDNPKGYGEGEDPRKYHPKLRPPVHPEEYAVDPNTGMKNYIANETSFWDTSKAHVRRLLERCIASGRRYRQSKNQDDKYDAYRDLGSAMHTLEDFFAHSNFCELTLRSIGGWDAFPHVGENTKIRAPNGQYVYPLVTGTFGGSDFIHSLLGEATDHLSQSSLTELDTQLNNAHNKQSSGKGSLTDVKSWITKIPGLGGGDTERDMENMERTRASNSGKDPNKMTPQEIKNAIWPFLVFRDNIVTKLETIIGKIPGLQEFVTNLMDAITVFILTALEPFIRPLIEVATKNLTEGSAAVVNNHDQYEVFNDPNCSDPTHSFLSKDHFGTILNEPAGNLAKLVVLHSVPQITAAWDNPSTNVRAITEDILQCLFHPDWHDRNSVIQVQIMSYMGKWMNSHGPAQQEVARRLGREAVKRHENVRFEGQVQGALFVTAGPATNNAGPAPSPGSVELLSSVGGVTGVLGKLGFNDQPPGPRREYSGGPPPGPSPGYFPPGPPPVSAGRPGYASPPLSYGGPPAPPYGGPSSFSPPGPPSGIGSPPFPSGGGFPMPSYDSRENQRELKRELRAEDRALKEEARDHERSARKEDKERRKAEKKRAKEARKHAHGNYGDRDYVPSPSDSSDSDEPLSRVADRHHHQGPPSFPDTFGPPAGGGYPLRDREGSVASSYGPPSGPPPGQHGPPPHHQDSHHYGPPPGPPPGGSSFMSMPSAPGGPPGFPPAPGFGGPPHFPDAPGGGFAPPPGAPPPFPGRGRGGPGYPGAGFGRHQYSGGSSGW